VAKHSGNGIGATGCRIGSDWTGWDSHVAHPDAPLGGGGPGNVSRFPQGRESRDLPDPWSPGGRGTVELAQADAPRPPNLPPATEPRVVGTFRSASSAFYDVAVTAEVVADGHGLPTRTTFSQVDYSMPGTEATPKGRILSFDGKFTWKGAITIKTYFGDLPRTLACYGRGTTAQDIRNGDITLGFHEHCHQNAFIRYLQQHPLPSPPPMAINMKLAAYEAGCSAFEAAIQRYWENMTSVSNAEVDDVGYTLAQSERDGCYRHQVP
jgi:hypothetical protein